MINLDRSFYSFVTIHACDGLTDGRTDGQNSHLCMECRRGSAFHAAW